MDGKGLFAAILRTGQVSFRVQQHAQSIQSVGHVPVLVAMEFTLYHQGGTELSLGVIVAADGRRCRNIRGRRVRLVAIDMCPEAKPARGDGKHAPELAAAENANGATGRQRQLRHSLRGPPPPMQSAPRAKP